MNTKNRVYNCYLEYLVKAKEIGNRIILIDQGKHKDLVFYFTKYNCEKSARMSSLYCHKLMEKLKNMKEKALND